MKTVDDVFQNLVQCMSLRAKVSTERVSERELYSTHMQIAICVRWSIVQHKRRVFCVVPLIRESEVSSRIKPEN
jgi:hypothetical protein